MSEDTQETVPSTEALLNSLFWKDPLVPLPEESASLFCNHWRVPEMLRRRDMPIFFTALTQLSHLVHDVAINVIGQGYHASPLRHLRYVDGISTFFRVSLQNTLFMHSLRPRAANDDNAVTYLRFLLEASPELVTRWNAAVNPNAFVASPENVKLLWVAAKESADAISARTVAFSHASDRIELRYPMQHTAHLFFISVFSLEGCIYAFAVGSFVWTVCGVVFAWLLWNPVSLFRALIVLGLATFHIILLFAAVIWLARRRRTARRGAKRLLNEELTGNDSHNCDGLSPVVSKGALEFSIQVKNNSVSHALSIGENIIDRQIVMIGVTDFESLTVCRWNLAARVATGIAFEHTFGKSLEVVMDPRSVPFARRLFDEIKQIPEKQERLLLNSLTKGSVAIRATATTAYIDGSPIGMLVGTVLDEDEQTMLAYFSRTGSATLLSKLRDYNVTDQISRDLVMSNTWGALKERTTQARRNWRPSTVEEITKTFTCPPGGMKVELHVQKDIPRKFQCDSFLVQYTLDRILKAIRLRSACEIVRVSVNSVKHDMEQCELLCVRVDVPHGCQIRVDAGRDVWVLLNAIAYIFQRTKTSIEIRYPISPVPTTKPQDTLPKVDSWIQQLPVCTFVVFEQDPVYAMHLRSLCVSHQHRCIHVDSLTALDTVLDSLGSDVSAALLSKLDAHFSVMAHHCRERGVFVVSISSAPESSMQFLGQPINGTPFENKEFHYALHHPIMESAWKNFLHHLSAVRKKQRTITAPASHEYRKIRTIARGNNSCIDLVRDVLTGGILARKTVFLTADRSLSSLTAEAEIMSLVGKHSCVIRHISSYSPTPGEFSMLLQFCQMGSLWAFVELFPQKRLTPTQLIPFARQLLSAVEYIHTKRVAHRDIKPENILMFDERHLKLADFGSATQKPLHAGHTEGGTPAYMAPERLMEVEASKWKPHEMESLFAEDIWSVGMTLLDVLGAYPEMLRGLKRVEEFLHVFTELRDQNRELCFSIPPGTCTHEVIEQLTSFLGGMLYMHPSRRLSASELLLHEYLQSSAWEAWGDVDWMSTPATNSLSTPLLVDRSLSSQCNFFSFLDAPFEKNRERLPNKERYVTLDVEATLETTAD